jgi:hypothetical protein
LPDASPPTPPPEKNNGSGRVELRIPLPYDVLDDPRIPPNVRESREAELAEYPDALRRQAIEMIIRKEMRLVGIKSSLINQYFALVPLDGMLWWINQAYVQATRNPGGFIATMLKRTGGAIPASAA